MYVFCIYAHVCNIHIHTSKLFWKGQLAKLEIALAKGKKNYDKKQTKKTADIQRDQERALKKYK